jgi:hypothetical protein
LEVLLHVRQFRLINVYKTAVRSLITAKESRGTADWEKKSAENIEKGYTPVSMKNDFSVIYGEGITKAEQQYVPAE